MTCVSSNYYLLKAKAFKGVPMPTPEWIAEAKKAGTVVINDVEPFFVGIKGSTTQKHKGPFQTKELAEAWLAWAILQHSARHS